MSRAFRAIILMAVVWFYGGSTGSEPFDETIRAPAPQHADGDAAFDQEIEVAARSCQLDPLLIKAVISVESEFDFLCVSDKGAAGLMQLLPNTARILDVKDIFVPQDNITGGARHLGYLLRRYHNNLPLALAAYNAGEGPVRRYQRIPPYPETQHYVKKVLEKYAAYRAVHTI